MERISVRGGKRALFVGQHPGSTYALTGWTKDGRPVSDRVQ